jgi:hypothetical protein
MQYPGSGYKIDGQSRSNSIGLGDKLIYSLVLYGERDYTMFFCATNEFNPVHFILKDGGSNEVIYDNKSDDFIETISFKVERTRNVKVEISVLAEKASEELVSGFLGCSGLLIYWAPDKK